MLFSYREIFKGGTTKDGTGFLDLKDILDSGLLGGKSKNSLGTDAQHKRRLKIRPLWGLFLGQ